MSKRFTREHYFLGLLFVTFLYHLVFAHNASAQVTTEITSSGLNTEVSLPSTLPNGQVSHNITGGTRPGGGLNLFHSFGEFSVANGHIANFLNDAGLPTSNILSRVTDGNSSSIFGTLQTTGFGNANLFLFNPAGVVFGPTATLNVGGSVQVSTADYLKLADGVQFTAIPGPQDALLSVAPVVAFGFLGPGSPSAISVNGATLTVKNGKTLSLIGGNSTFADPENLGALVAPGVTLEGSKVSAPGGQINLVRVEQPVDAAIPGEISLNGPGQPVGVTQTGLTSAASLVISKGTQGTIIDMSGSGPSAVRIRGGQLVMNEWQMEVRSPATGQPAGIDMILQNSAVLSGSSVSTTRGISLSAGPITIRTPNLSLTDSSISIRGGGLGVLLPPGNLTLNVAKLDLKDSDIGVQVSFCCSSLLGSPLVIQGLNGAGTKADAVLMSGGGISGGGIDGSISIFANTMEMKDGARIHAQTVEGNPGAPISITVGTLTLTEDSTIETGTNQRSFQPAQPITITATGSIAISNSKIVGTTHSSGKGADITITSQSLSLSDGAKIESKTLRDSSFGSGRGEGGNITLNVGKLRIEGASRVDTGSVNVLEFFSNTGSGGHITVQGRGGQGTNAASVDISGEASGLFSEANSRGPAGTILVNANKVNLGNDGVISVSTFGVDAAATGGEVTINAKDITVSNGASITAESTGVADAGSIRLTAQNNLQLNKGVISTKSLGIGAAGSILLDAGNNLVINKSTISAENLGGGPVGSILLRSGNLILLNNSTVKPFPLIDLY